MPDEQPVEVRGGEQQSVTSGRMDQRDPCRDQKAVTFIKVEVG